MRRPRAWIGLIPVAMLGTTATAQVPRVEVAFAANAATSSLPAIAWLCGTALPLRHEWPDGLSPNQSFSVRLSAGGLTITANEIALPEGALIAGSVEYEPDKRALCICSNDGTEDWYVPRGTTPPLAWIRLLDLVRATDMGRAHTIDAAVAAGHMLGATAKGDPTREPIQLGAALCGEVTWKAWLTTEHLRVRGRSEGGLLLPAILLVLAQQKGNAFVTELPMRAFTARDGDREEAVRQMSRQTTSRARKTLVAMLYGSDELRLTAIDTLVRQGATEELPRIVKAAAPSLPLTTVAAADAVAAMWHGASEPTKARTRAALAGSSAKALRSFDLSRIPGRPSQQEPVVVHWRLLAALFVLAVGVFGLWLRERSRTIACV